MGGAKGSSLLAFPDQPPRPLTLWEEVTGTLMKAVILLGALALVGCGRQCQRQSFVYRMEFVPLSGNCGTIQTTTGAVDFTTEPALLGCSGTRVRSEDYCEVTVNKFACPANGTQGVLTGKLVWNDESTSATGNVDITVLDGNGGVVCSGTYRATYTKA